MNFGVFLRNLRQERNLGLRGVAKSVGMSVNYLSKVERGELPPPAEEKVVALAQLFGEDPDQCLAIAGRLPSDLPPIIRQHPQEWAAFLRSMRRLNGQQLRKILLFFDEGVMAAGVAEQQWFAELQKNLLGLDRDGLRRSFLSWAPIFKKRNPEAAVSKRSEAHSKKRKLTQRNSGHRQVNGG